MRFNHWIWLALATGSAKGGEIYSDKVKQFEIQPQVCIVKQIGEPCKLATTVQWETTEVMKVCLMQQGKVLQCWEDKQKIREKLALVLHQSTSLDLVNAHQDKLASELLEVNAVNPKQRRRRLRPAWSLF